MNRAPFVTLFVITAVAVAGGCSPRYDVNVAWTVDGFAAKDECQALTAPGIALRLEQQDSEGGPVLEETATATCGDGAATVQSAAFSDLFIDLKENDAVFGSVGPIHLKPGYGEYPGADAAAPVRADIKLQRGILKARFTVVGKDCGAANADSFDVTLRRNGAPLGEEVLVEDQTVNCTDGVATFDFEPVELGSVYDFLATTTIGSDSFSTTDDGGGAGVLITSIVNNIVVDLDAVGRP